MNKCFNVKVLLIGASSFIGKYFYSSLKKQTNLAVTGTQFSKTDKELLFLDITNKIQLETFIKKQFEVVILLAGNKNVKECELDYAKAYKINTQPVVDIIDLINKFSKQTHLIYFSSDYVFSGARGNYSSQSLTNPKTNYGITKLQSEKLLRKSKINHTIIRTSAVMGKEGIFWSWMLNELKTKSELGMFGNLFFSPTPINLLFENIMQIITDLNINNKQTIHIVGNQKYSRYEFAVFINKLFNINPNLKINKELADYSKTLLQKDLSMQPSPLCAKYLQNKSLTDIYQQLIK